MDPALSEDKTAACSRLSIGNNGNLAIPVGCGVTRAVDEAGHVEGLSVDERHGLPGDLHVSFEGLAGIPLGLPDLILMGAIHPEEQLFLGAFCLLAAAIGRLNGLEGLEVVGDVFAQVS